MQGGLINNKESNTIKERTKIKNSIEGYFDFNRSYNNNLNIDEMKKKIIKKLLKEKCKQIKEIIKLRVERNKIEKKNFLNNHRDKIDNMESVNQKNQTPNNFYREATMIQEKIPEVINCCVRLNTIMDVEEDVFSKNNENNHYTKNKNVTPLSTYTTKENTISNNNNNCKIANNIQVFQTPKFNNCILGIEEENLRIINQCNNKIDEEELYDFEFKKVSYNDIENYCNNVKDSFICSKFEENGVVYYNTNEDINNNNYDINDICNDSKEAKNLKDTDCLFDTNSNCSDDTVDFDFKNSNKFYYIPVFRKDSENNYFLYKEMRLYENTNITNAKD